MFPGWIFLEVNSQLFSLQVQSWQEKFSFPKGRLYSHLQRRNRQLWETGVFMSIQPEPSNISALPHLYVLCTSVFIYAPWQQTGLWWLEDLLTDYTMLHQKLLGLCHWGIWARGSIKVALTNENKKKDDYKCIFYTIFISFACSEPPAVWQQPQAAAASAVGLLTSS